MTTSHIEEFGTGWTKWNPQAWVDFFVVKVMMGKVSDVIPKTYVPILRLVSDDAGKVDDAYRQVLALREPIRLFDSPRDKWRRMYGSYIRELEWVYGELRKHFPKHEYEELVVDIMARTIQGALGTMLPTVSKSTQKRGQVARDPVAGGKKPFSIGRAAGRMFERIMSGFIGRWMMANMNPVNAIVGPIELKRPPEGGLQLYIPRCWMHTAPGDGATKDQTCLWACKGACERVFGPESIAPMYFEPHLPDFSCTLTVAPGGAAPEKQAV